MFLKLYHAYLLCVEGIGSEYMSRVEAREQLRGEMVLYPSVTWDQRIELRSSGLTTRAFTHWAIGQAHKYMLWNTFQLLKASPLCIVEFQMQEPLLAQDGQAGGQLWRASGCWPAWGFMGGSEEVQLGEERGLRVLWLLRFRLCS